MSNVVLFGTGDFARAARVYLDADSPHEVVAFTVHERYREATTLEGLPVVAFEEMAERYPPDANAMRRLSDDHEFDQFKPGSSVSTVCRPPSRSITAICVELPRCTS